MKWKKASSEGYHSDSPHGQGVTSSITSTTPVLPYAPYSHFMHSKSFQHIRITHLIKNGQGVRWGSSQWWNAEYCPECIKALLPNLDLERHDTIRSVYFTYAACSPAADCRSRDQLGTWGSVHTCLLGERGWESNLPRSYGDRWGRGGAKTGVSCHFPPSEGESKIQHAFV